MCKKRRLIIPIVIIIVTLILTHSIQVVRIEYICKKIYANYIAEIEFHDENNIKKACGIIVNENTILTVAHLFNKPCSYVNIDKHIRVNINDTTYLPMNLFIDFDCDLCAIVTSECFPQCVKFTQTLNKYSYLINEKGELNKVSLLGTASIRRNLILTTNIIIDQRFNNGKSGLPVVDSSGTVIGILSANDKFFNRSYVIPTKIIENFLNQIALNL